MLSYVFLIKHLYFTEGSDINYAPNDVFMSSVFNFPFSYNLLNINLILGPKKSDSFKNACPATQHL